MSYCRALNLARLMIERKLAGAETTDALKSAAQNSYCVFLKKSLNRGEHGERRTRVGRQENSGI